MFEGKKLLFSDGSTTNSGAEAESTLSDDFPETKASSTISSSFISSPQRLIIRSPQSKNKNKISQNNNPFSQRHFSSILCENQQQEQENLIDGPHILHKQKQNSDEVSAEKINQKVMFFLI